MYCSSFVRYFVVSGIIFSTTGLTAQAACPSSVGRFIANGPEVFDQVTGLIWQRCSVGQSWNDGACVGKALGLSHEQALLYAKDQNGWRLPNVKELFSLIDIGCERPSIDGKFFPNTLDSHYWTSTPYLGNISGQAYTVSFGSGITFGVSRQTFHEVRLVRPSF